MKEALRPTPFKIVSDNMAQKMAFAKIHQEAVKGIKEKKQFQAMIPEIVTPHFVACYGNLSQPMAVREIMEYVKSLIPVQKGYVMEFQRDENGNILEDEKGKPIKVRKMGPDGKPILTDVPLFELTTGYAKIQELVDKTFVSLSVYWDAHHWAKQNMSTINEQLFDRMNDYLWRNIMAVVYPEDVKREFKHFCITVKRKLYYLGDRDQLPYQTTFGLYSDDGGNGKTTLLKAMTHSFSGGFEPDLPNWDSLFKFNLNTASNFGIAFVDEDPPVDREKKDMLKQFIDSSTRKVEGKGIESINVNNLLTLVVSANHKISSYLFEDEARGQRRDAFFQVIGNLIQYGEDDMRVWFSKMFACCPFDSDAKTYHHYNPHQSEMNEHEMYVLSKLDSAIDFSGGYDTSPLATAKWRLGTLAAQLGIKPSDKSHYHALRTLLKCEELFELWVDHSNGKWYKLKPDALDNRVHCHTFNPPHDGWTPEWRNAQPHIDVDKVIAELEDSSREYDSTSTIRYSDRWEADI